MSYLVVPKHFVLLSFYVFTHPPRFESLRKTSNKDIFELEILRCFNHAVIYIIFCVLFLCILLGVTIDSQVSTYVELNIRNTMVN